MSKDKKKLLISGANGLVGKYLAPALKRENYDVFTLVREKPKNPFEIEWNSEMGISQSELFKMENFAAVIHLAGAGLTEKRWTKKCKQLIYESRVNGTKVLVDALGKLENPPPVFACASVYGNYGETTGDKILTEKSPAGKSLPHFQKKL